VGRKSFTPDQFFEYLAKPLTPEQVDVWFKAHNIDSEKSNLFFDYICSLYNLIFDTYLGEDVINTEENKKSHFNWCWNKNLNNFKLENVHFKSNGEHYDYFWNFFSVSFYSGDEDDDFGEKVDDYLSKLFKLHVQKTKSDLEVLTDIYKLMENNLIVD